MFKTGGQEHQLYIKLKTSLSKRNFTTTITKAYFLFGLPNSSENYSALKKSIFNSDLKILSKSVQYDVKADNIELYLIEDEVGKRYFIILLDPYELYEGEDISEIIQTSANQIDFESELIYSSKTLM